MTGGKKFVIIVPSGNALGPFSSKEKAESFLCKCEKGSFVTSLLSAPPKRSEPKRKQEVPLAKKSELKEYEEGKMDATYRKEKSLHGHALDVLKSGLQKYIRRGNVEGAMYCLGELDLFSGCEGGERIRTNMIHRLMIIFMEDVGLGGVKSWARIDELVSEWLKDRSKTRSIQELVQLMCASKKTRACSFARAFAQSLPDDEKRTLEEQIRDKDWVSIKTLLQRLNQKSLVKDYKRVSEEMARAGVQDMHIALKWVKEVKTIERPLFFLLPLLNYIFGGYCMENVIPTFDENWRAHTSLPTMEFDDYVFDKHTRKGTRDRAYFVNVSSKVENEVFVLPECFADEYYGRGGPVQSKPSCDSKQLDTPAELETSYELVTRCQLVTTGFKTDSVIARDPSGKLVFLKGPFKTDEPVKFFLKMQEEKARRGIPAVEGRLIYLKPDRWNETPLGVRNSLDLSKAWPFLESEILFKEEDIKLKSRKSTLWPETIVLDCEAMKLTVNPLKLTGVQLKDWIAAVRFREEFRIGDFADRNFLLGKDGRVYSVDEEAANSSPIDLEKQLKKQRYALLTKNIQTT